jgi:hypothetical protein
MQQSKIKYRKSIEGPPTLIGKVVLVGVKYFSPKIKGGNADKGVLKTKSNSLFNHFAISENMGIWHILVK